MAEDQTASPSIPTVSTGGSSPYSSMDIQQIASMAGLGGMGVPPSTTVTNSAQAPVVNVPHSMQYTPRPMVQPLANTSSEINRARRANSFRDITNAVGSFMQKRSEEKTDALKTQITSVLAAQKRIAEATTILQNDPNNKNAKAVLDSNKKVMDGILGGKDSKAIQKAFDISFTDPQKNKTPEVAAMKAAMSEFDTAHKAGHDINTPQEAAVASAAGNNAPAVQATVPGGQQNNGPQLNVRPGVQLNPGSDTSNVNMNPQQVHPTVPGGTSKTPYAEQFLGKQPLELNANPQYAQYKEQLDKRTAEAGKILPDLIKQQTSIVMKSMTEEGATQRAAARDLLQYKQNSERIQAQLKMQNMRDSAAYSRVVKQGQDAMARATLHGEITLGAANDPRIKGTPLEQQLKLKGLNSWQTAIAKETHDLVTLQSIYDTAAVNKEAPQEKLEELKTHIQFDQWNLKQLEDNRNKYTEQAWGKGVVNNPPPVAKSGGGIMNGLESVNKSPLGYFTDPLGKMNQGASNGDGSKSTELSGTNKTEVVGNNLSDDEGIPAEETDGDIDPDNFDQ